MHSSLDITYVIKLKLIRCTACMGKKKIVYRVLVGNPEGKRSLLKT
jgi:hypothetical protein